MNPIEHSLKSIIQKAIQTAFHLDIDLSDIVIEVPKNQAFGDYSTNVAMRLSKQLSQNPRIIAQTILDSIKDTKIQSMSIAGPGFLNFVLDTQAITQIIHDILNQDKHYGHQTPGSQPLKINVEYVSANPTGDLHPGHARGAAIGDALTRLMKAAGYEVTREYYLNDAGNQINQMARSLRARYLQICGLDCEVPQDGYHGQDMIDIAHMLHQEFGSRYQDLSEEDSLEKFRAYGLMKETEKLRDDLKKFRVEFDVWSSEQSLYDQGLVAASLKKLEELGQTYVQDQALWLKTTAYGDDKDRVLVKSDGSYTYIVPDIAYHVDKKTRGYDVLVNLWGADHHGYIPRLKAAMMSLGYAKDTVEVDIIQMARMIKDGQEFKLSKRTGKAVALKDLIDEAGVDAVRYYFVSKAGDTHMDLDLDMASSQSQDNPVYYAQYAHARMCSILRQDNLVTPTTFELIQHPKEIELLKQLADFPQLILDVAKIRQPHLLCIYIQKLAASFHSFYGECQVLHEDLTLRQQRLALVKAVQITLRNALTLIGVDALERM
jgi:arginyl-tRNA synthetase